jgi:hypothetical protein
VERQFPTDLKTSRGVQVPIRDDHYWVDSLTRKMNTRVHTIRELIETFDEQGSEEEAIEVLERLYGVVSGLGFMIEEQLKMQAS